MKFIFLKVVLAVLLLAEASLAFSQDLVGEYFNIGRRCENSGDLIPPDEKAMKLSFYQNGSFKHVYSNYIDPPSDPLDDEDFLEQEQQIRDRHLSWFEQDKARHEEICESYEQAFTEDGDDECDPSVKKRLYSDWQANREREAENEWEEVKNTMARDYEYLISEGVFGNCIITVMGSYLSQNNRLTLFINDVTATRPCGLDNSYPRTISVPYYFENNDLHLVLGASEKSQEYCGSSDISEFYSKY